MPDGRSEKFATLNLKRGIQTAEYSEYTEAAVQAVSCCLGARHLFRFSAISGRWEGSGLKSALLNRCLAVVLLAAVLLSPNARGQLFDNLKAFGNRLSVGDPSVGSLQRADGPKGIAVADLDGDGRPDIAVSDLDGTITVYFGETGGKFSPPLYLHTGVDELRGIVCADLTGDGRMDIAVAAPYAGNVYLFANQGGRTFGAASILPAWRGARALVAGDFDGDGRQDLAVAGPNNGVRHYRGTGGGAFDVPTNLAGLNSASSTFPQPYYVLAAFRPAGATRDEVVVTHDETNLISVLAIDTNGVLQITGVIANEFAHALDVGAINQPAANGTLDLVTAQLDLGTVTVHPGISGTARFGQTIGQIINVPGGPRALKVVDLDGDGWNDLVVVLRNFDRVLTYHNSNGVLVAASETPVGTSPRELASGDFNGDGHPDLAVMNRGSHDVSVLMTYPGQAGFSILDETYPVDGDVAGLAVMDFNHDGRDDVLQLHRASSEFSVRLANTNGTLGPPTFYPMGSLPNQHTIADVNNDHISDVITVNLGRPGIEQGSLSVRLGNGDGTFGPEIRSGLPSGVEGRFFAVVAADFDNDGNTDLAVGFFDCRIVFFKGHGDGTFQQAGDHEHLFVYEARGMVAGDFNQDGLIDLAGVGFYGSLVVVENHGDIMTAPYLDKVIYNPRCCGGSEAGSIKLVDENNDGDPDILISSSLGTTLYLGGPGTTFTLASNTTAELNIPASSIAVADFDGDGRDDLAVSCKILSCVTLLTQDANGDYIPALSVNVPSGGFLATGDLDGDGKPDLIGSGSVLWTALSSRRAQPGPPLSGSTLRPTIPGPVINELLALNTIFPLAADGGRFSDWLELYNGAATDINMLSWRVRLVKAADPSATNVAAGWITNEFKFGSNIVFASGGHLLLVCSDKLRSPLHTGFKLPGEGGTLSLIHSNGTEVDRVQYSQQDYNVSYSRYRDGVASFVSSAFPSPGRANVDNGPLDPTLKFDGADLATLQPDMPIRLFATGHDDVGIVSVSLIYRRLDVPDAEMHRVALYDDGLHGDGGMLDGQFSGLLEEGLPDGAEIEFYLECVNLTDNTITLPGDAAFARPGEPISIYSLVVGGSRPPVEISELVANNRTGLHDEFNGTPPWVEIRNCSTNPLALGRISLAHKYFETGSRLDFTNGQVLAPGEHLVFYCDNNPSQGLLHAPFSLNRAGDQLALTSLTTNGARALIDSIVFGPQSNDVAYARLGCGGPWINNTPTPRAENVPGAWMGLVQTNGTFTFAFRTTLGKTYVVEQADSVNAPSWTALAPIPGDGIEKTLTQPLGRQRFYRVREVAQ